ncbi:MAG: hypothetical protein JNK56_15055 [Myxococcales bacterium]|nr:hypothetical protein [Myxococcales bacterium]
MSTRALALSSLSLALGGCFLTPEYAFIEADDVMIEPVRAVEERALTEYGDLYAISMQSAHEVGGTLAAAVEGIEKVLKLLDRFPSDVDEAGYRVYGPYHPRDAEVSWLFRLDGDPEGSRFEVWVGPASAGSRAAMQELLSGEVSVTRARRSGAFHLDFDVYEAYGAALKIGADRDRHYTGAVELRFERETESELKTIDIDYDDFTITQEIPIHDEFAATSYRFARAADGSGSFHVDLAATFQAALWSGPAIERAVIDMAWQADGAGRAHGELRSAVEGDLLLGDMVLDECFAGRGALIWRAVNEAYAAALPGYNKGDRRGCAAVTVGDGG